MKLFNKAKSLELKIDSFLDLVIEAGLHFNEGIKLYLNQQFEEFEDRINNIRILENNADNLRRDIETQLYSYTLIPESRGDVLGLLENIDNIINKIKATLLEFSIEHPQIPYELNQNYLDLTNHVINAAEAITRACRAFFRDLDVVRDHIKKVMFYEKEADKAAENLKRKIFKSDLGLALKFQLRNFSLHIDSVADNAENVADRLAIYTIKRSI